MRCITILSAYCMNLSRVVVEVVGSRSSIFVLVSPLLFFCCIYAFPTCVPVPPPPILFLYAHTPPPPPPGPLFSVHIHSGVVVGVVCMALQLPEAERRPSLPLYSFGALVPSPSPPGFGSGVDRGGGGGRRRRRRRRGGR